MRLFLLLCAAFACRAAASVSDLPACGLACLVEALPQTPCTATNTTCICTSTELTELVTICVTANCTAIEMLETKNVTSSTCGVAVRSKETRLRITAITLFVVTGFFVIVRCVFRLVFISFRLEPDDWCILVTTVIAIPQMYIITHGVLPNGLGRDVWTVPVKNIYNFGRFLYALEMQYFMNLMLLKVSLLLFYLRIFPERRIRRILWSTIGFVVGASVVFIFLAIFQCQPISYYWTRWDGEHTGHCLNVNAIAWAHAGFSIATDFWMIAIPLSQLRHIKLSWKKKAGVGMMFCVGTFVTVVSILRLHSLLTFAKSSNPTWENADVSNWSTIEVCIGIICTCMPSIRVILARVSPGIFGGSTKPTYMHYPDYGNNTGQLAKGSRSIPLVSTGHRSRANHTTHTTVTINDPADAVDADASMSKAGTAGTDQDAHGILYSKSYTVEYGAEYNDQARLVHSQSGSMMRQDSGERARSASREPRV